jgi:serine/threonine-protein kinase
MITRRLLCLLLAAVLPAPAARAQGSEGLAERAREVLRRHCLECHGDKEVKGGLRVLDPSALVDRRLIDTKAPDASELLQLVVAGSMPPGRLAKVPPAEQRALREWVAAGAPPFPPEVGDAYVLRKVVEDLAGLKAKRGADPKALASQRYFSFNHLLLSPEAGAERALWPDALALALNHLSWNPEPVRPVAIEPTQTVFRVDLRGLGWEVEPFEVYEGPKDPLTPSRVNLFDLVLLEYPFATAGDLSKYGPLLGEYLGQAGLVRPIPYVRGDWFVSVATQPPLYEDLLRLPRKLAALEKKLGVGPDREARAGFPDARDREVRHLVARRPSAHGACWRTWDLRSQAPLDRLARGEPPRAGAQILFSLPNGLHGYFLAGEDGRRLEVAPPEAVADPLARDGLARNGLSCIRCHDQGVQPFTDAARAALTGAPLAAGVRDRLLALYPGREALDRLLAGDRQRYLSALEKVRGPRQDRNPLALVSKRFLAAAPAQGRVLPVSLTLKAEAEAMRALLRQVRWERLEEPPGPSVLPLDGLAYPQYEPLAGPLPVTLVAVNHQTGRPATVFHPRDELQVLVTNRGPKAVYFELVNTLMDGRRFVQVPVRRLGPGEQYCYPRDTKGKHREFFKLDENLGTDRYTVYASEEQFPPGKRLRVKVRGEDLTDRVIADRVVHPFYELAPDRKSILTRFNPARLVKMTIDVQTKEP